MHTYPRRLYLNGEVIPGDLHATNSVIVRNAEEEATQRAAGYRVAYENHPKFGGNGGSTADPAVSPGHQAGAAPDSAGPPDGADEDSYSDLAELRARATVLGVKVDGRWGEGRLRQEILDKVEEIGDFERHVRSGGLPPDGGAP